MEGKLDDGVDAALLSESHWERSLGASLLQEQWLRLLLTVLASVPILIALSIVITLLFESVSFFADIPLWHFLVDTDWTPQMQAGNAQYGIIVLVTATLMVTVIAMFVAIPVGLMGAIYLAEYAGANVRRFLKPALESLSGVPTVIFGYFALLFLTPLFRNTIFPGISGFNALSAGIAIGILVAPTISSLSEEALRRIPNELRAGALALGMTKSESIVRVLLPGALPGVMAAIALALSLALGDTMIAAIAAGQRPVLTLNPFVPIETMTAFIVSVSLGTVEFGSIVFKAIFTVGMVLFVITLALNLLSSWLTRRGEERATRMLLPARELKKSSDVGAAQPGQLLTEPPMAVSNLPKLQFPEPASRRFWFERGFRMLATFAAFTGIVVLMVLFLDLVVAGFPRLSWDFLTSFSSRRPLESGIYAPLVGSLWMLAIVLVLVVPIGVGTAIYLEEYYPDNLINRAISTSIANLAAVPSIIYGLLGLELFVRVLRPITGGYSILSAGLTLSVIVLPVTIIASRSALAAVPKSLRRGGYALGMTKEQVLRTIAVPTALPGILTGVIQSVSRALGETAALVAVGALASIRFLPSLSLDGLRSQYTVLPVQIFYWLQESDEAVQANAAAATIVLVSIVLVLNVGGVLLRDYSSRRFT
ncbi:phosphate ABC transporter, permease protein [Rubidibacter lacunae KORDI 51-2]|uniref:Phosphate ABC transporter, permease protein n=1 Tax=Rubidibacter lacunae KORDI 51-2 TaxID=582515 RepID=U5DKX9_9CHRO|nr:phosphate ABC transporter permease PstA [Rubidibacter lacunae]ERN41552.1 phosphate ABC transporter, permease protein [Rubidibacter lacunae KORDI 51-2]